MKAQFAIEAYRPKKLRKFNSWGGGDIVFSPVFCVFCMPLCYFVGLSVQYRCCSEATKHRLLENVKFYINKIDSYRNFVNLVQLCVFLSVLIKMEVIILNGIVINIRSRNWCIFCSVRLNFLRSRVKERQKYFFVKVGFRGLFV